MKVYLINPPAADGVRQVREGRCMQRAGAWTSVWTPISLAYCATVLRNSGIDVKLTDCIVENIDFIKLQKLAKQFSPEFVVINVATPSIMSDLLTINYIKQIDSKIRTAIIGIHATALPEQCFDLQPSLDFVVRGEPEYTIQSLSLSIKNNKNFKEIKGITFKENNKIIHNPDRELISNLDELGFPAWDLIKTELYRMPFSGEKFLLVATGRGCPYKCTFCADNTYYGKKLRLRSPENIVDELEHNKIEFGIDSFLFWAESFTINRNFAIFVAEEIIRRNLKIRWVCNSRVDNVDLEMLKKFKQAGCWMIGYGVESGNQKIIDSVNKGIKIQNTIDAVKWSKHAGLEVTAHCVLGFPADTVKTIKETIKFVKNLNIEFAQFYCAVPFPGSELYLQAKKNGWICNWEWEMFEQNFSVLKTSNFSPEQIMRLRKKAYFEFYIRPKIIIKTIQRIKTPSQLIFFIKMLKDFVTWI